MSRPLKARRAAPRCRWTETSGRTRIRYCIQIVSLKKRVYTDFVKVTYQDDFVLMFLSTNCYALNAFIVRSTRRFSFKFSSYELPAWRSCQSTSFKSGGCGFDSRRVPFLWSGSVGDTGSEICMEIFKMKSQTIPLHFASPTMPTIMCRHRKLLFRVAFIQQLMFT